MNIIDYFILTILMFLLLGFLKIQVNKQDILKLKMYEWIISTKDMYAVMPHQFDEWCSNFLIKLGYKNVEIVSEHRDGGKDIICTKNSKTVYVECVQLGIIKNDVTEEVSYETLGRPDAQKFVGNMRHDKVKYGIIMTNGRAAGEALDYVATLPDDYKVKILTGDDLFMQQLEFIKDNYLRVMGA